MDLERLIEGTDELEALSMEEKFAKQGLTFDDVLLVPAESAAVSYTHLTLPTIYSV